MVLGLTRKNNLEKYRQLIGKRVETPSGVVLGVVTKVKVDKKTGKLVSIVYKTEPGFEHEVKVNGNIVLKEDAIVLLTEHEIKEHSSIIDTVRHNVAKIKEKNAQLDEMYRRLIQLLLEGKIDNTTFNEVKSRLDSEREKLHKACEEAIKTIDDALRDLERKVEELKRKQHELYAKKVLGNLTPEEESEIRLIEELLEKLRYERHELSRLRFEVLVECS